MIGGVDVAKSPGIEVVNGTIEQYKASTSTISANSFVEFVNITIGTDAAISSTVDSYTDISAIALDNTRVFVAHRSDSTNNYLNGIVCTISGNTITAGTDTTLSTNSGTYKNAKVVLVDTNKVFIAHRYSTSSNYLNGIVCTINNTNITVGTDTRINNNRNTGDVKSMVLLQTNKVFIAYGDGNYQLYGVVCTVSGTSISNYTGNQQISSIDYSSEGASAVVLDSTHVFIAHNSDSLSYCLYGIICTISSVINTGTDTGIVIKSYASSNTSACLLSTNKVFVAHRSDSTNNYLNGIVCTISGTTITKGTDTTLVSNDGAYQNANACLVGVNKVLVAHASDSINRYLNAIICTISNTTISTDVDVSVVDNTNSYEYANAVLLSDNKIFIAHRSDSSNNYLNGIMVDLTPTIKESTSKIDGITKTECTTTSAGEVYVL